MAEDLVEPADPNTIMLSKRTATLAFMDWCGWDAEVASVAVDAFFDACERVS